MAACALVRGICLTKALTCRDAAGGAAWRKAGQQDGSQVNLADRASTPHAELPLPLLDGTPDRPDDAARVAVVENELRGS
jgi:hypothetical protein